MIDNRESVNDYYPTLPPQRPDPAVDDGVLTKHLNARENPHQVTAEQVGTYNKEYIDQEFQKRSPEALKESIAEIVEETQTEFNLVLKQAQDAAQESESHAEAAQTAEENASNSKALANDYAKSAKEWRNEAETFRHEAMTAKDEAVQTANQVSASVTNAQSFAKQAQGYKNEASASATSANASASSASNSAKSASTSATNAKTSEDNAKAYAIQAENATALKVDRRINTADDSEYPLIVMVEKDVYKFIAPKGLTETTRVRYCCDGMAHYFVSNTYFYEYDANLKFVKRVAFYFGYVYYNPYEGYRDFVTRMGDFYYLWSRTRGDIKRVSVNGGDADITATLIGRSGFILDYAQIFRNERSGNIIVFSKFTDGCGYIVFDQNLVQQGGVTYIDCVDNGNIYAVARLYHFNIPDNVTFVTFAPTDTTKNGVYYLDEKDQLVEVDVTEIRASGAFTSADLTQTGRTSANYFIPRIFYELQYRSNYHILRVFNGAKIVPLIVHPKKDGKPVTIEHCTFNGSAIGGIMDAYIKEANVPKSRLTATSVVMANGSGNNSGMSTYYQPWVCATNAIVTKPYQTGANIAYTDFAPDPMENAASYKPSAMSNTHPVYDKTSAPNLWHLYPAGDYSSIGGAIMFTV